EACHCHPENITTEDRRGSCRFDGRDHHQIREVYHSCLKSKLRVTICNAKLTSISGNHPCDRSMSTAKVPNASTICAAVPWPWDGRRNGFGLSITISASRERRRKGAMGSSNW